MTPGRFTPGAHWIGDWVGPKAAGRRSEEKILDPTGTVTPNPRSSSHYTDCGTPVSVTSFVIFTPLNINYHGDKIKNNERGELVECKGKREMCPKFHPENLKVKEYFGEGSVNRRIVLQRMIDSLVTTAWRVHGLRMEDMASRYGG
jgi:hypothetical protein